ncbi:MAG: DUF4428 domain-containing protein [Clostridia bacterium]|nr:DUF4428 domain-containing protein [Clostridia bacterium]
MGLFDRKYCSICGEKIGMIGGMLGIRKLEDGNLCKECQRKLSPFFSDKKNSTVEEIKEQLAYREENKKDVAAFHTTRTFGTGYRKIYIDENAKKLMISDSSDLAKANPDVIGFDQVTGCMLTVDESHTEEKTKDKDGKPVSYDPPHYVYSYDFDVLFTFNHKYFSQVKVQLNGKDVSFKTIGSAPNPIVIKMNRAYQENLALGEELKVLFDKEYESACEERAAAAAPKTAVVCPACGATTMPDATGCCEYCGTPVG